MRKYHLEYVTLAFLFSLNFAVITKACSPIKNKHYRFSPSLPVTRTSFKATPGPFVKVVAFDQPQQDSKDIKHPKTSKDNTQTTPINFDQSQGQSPTALQSVRSVQCTQPSRSVQVTRFFKSTKKKVSLRLDKGIPYLRSAKIDKDFRSTSDFPQKKSIRFSISDQEREKYLFNQARRRYFLKQALKKKKYLQASRPLKFGQSTHQNESLKKQKMSNYEPTSSHSVAAMRSRQYETMKVTISNTHASAIPKRTFFKSKISRQAKRKQKNKNSVVSKKQDTEATCAKSISIQDWYSTLKVLVDAKSTDLVSIWLEIYADTNAQSKLDVSSIPICKANGFEDSEIYNLLLKFIQSHANK